MAERERLTKKERREQSRDERKRKEATAAKKRKRNRVRNGLVTAVIVGGVAAVVLQAFLGGTATIEGELISAEDAEAAREAAGCEIFTDREPLPESFHFESQGAAPPLETIYTDVRPTHSGPHLAQTHPIISGGASSQIDELSTTHNLEHGSVIAWYDPDQVSGSDANAMGDWAATLNASGFRVDPAGVAVFVSPYEDPGISSGKAVAFRSWGVAMDCDAWDETVANSFVIEYYGTHGIAPERNFAPYPTEILAYEDREVGDSDAPLDTDTSPEDMLDDDADVEDLEEPAGDEPADGDEPEEADQ